MPRLVLFVALAVLVSTSAVAEEIKPLPPQRSLSQVPSARIADKGERSVALQLQIRQQDFLDRDRSSFDRNDRVMIVTPAERLGDKRFDRPKVLFGVVVRF